MFGCRDALMPWRKFKTTSATMKNWLKRNYFRLYNHKKKVKFGKNVILDTKNWFEGRNVVGENSAVATSKLGLGTYIADYSTIKHAIIGRFCSIGSKVQTGLGTHPAKVFVSTHPAFFSTYQQAGFSFVEKNIFEEQVFIDDQRRYVVEIGNDVWIGNNVTIVDGIKIGDGAVVATGAVVTKNVLPYTIVGGVPAKEIGCRFSPQHIEKLLTIKWWEWDFEKIQHHSHLFSNIDEFIANL